MTDKKDSPGKSPERPGDGQAAKRPFATIDLKATEVKVDELKAKQAAAAGPAATPGPEAATAAKVVAAAKAASSPSASKPAPEVAAAARKPGSTWSVDDALGDRKPTPEVQAAIAAVEASRPSALGRLVSHAVAGVLGGALALAGSQHVLPLLGVQPPRQPAPAATSLPPDLAARLAGIEKTVRERLVAADQPRPNPALDQAVARLAEMTKQVTALTEAQTRLDRENAALKEQVARQPVTAADTQRLQKLEEQLATIAAAAQADPSKAGRIPQLAQLTGQVRDLEAALSARLAALRKEVAQDIETRLAAGVEAGEAAKSGTARLDREVSGIKSETARLTQRLDQLKAAADKLDEVVRGVKDDTGGLKVSLDGFKGDVDARLKAAAKPADVATAVTPLSQKIAELEKSLAGILKAEDDRRSNTERIVLSLELGNLKRAMERGARYSAELAEVRRVAGPLVDLKPLEAYQTEGVPTIVTLTQDFRRIANAIIDAEAEQPGASVMDRIMGSAKTIVRVRKSEYAPDDTSAEAIVTRMEAALKDSRLSDVLAEAKKLTDKSRAPAAEWLRKVEARQTVDAAVVAIERALKTSLGAGGRPDTGPAPAPKGTKP